MPGRAESTPPTTAWAVGASGALALAIKCSSDVTAIGDVALEVLDRFVRVPIDSGTHGFAIGDRERDGSRAPVIPGRLKSITDV